MTEAARRLLTTKEVSEVTRIPVGTLENLRYQGDGEGPPYFRLGRRIVYDETDVWSWVDDQKDYPDPDGPRELRAHPRAS